MENELPISELVEIEAQDHRELAHNEGWDTLYDELELLKQKAREGGFQTDEEYIGAIFEAIEHFTPSHVLPVNVNINDYLMLN